MKNYCKRCTVEHCELRDEVNFCEDCAEYKTCPICYDCCESGHAIECNNGFESQNEYDEPVEDEDEV